MQIFHRLEALEKEWGKNHLRVENNNLIVFDKNRTIATIPINTSKDREFLEKFLWEFSMQHIVITFSLFQL